VKIFDPTVGVSAIQTLGNIGTAELSLSNHPVVIEPIAL
jgi:hypothetical protein